MIASALACHMPLGPFASCRAIELQKGLRLSVHHRLPEEEEIILSTVAAEPGTVPVHCRLQRQSSSNQGESSRPDLARSTPQLLESAAQTGTAAAVKPNFQRHSMGATGGSGSLSRSPSAKRRCVAWLCEACRLQQSPPARDVM